ncbi:MAG TPA: CpaF family protein [Victivallales bacterium]|nr:CpaF family protein [Victivallales bacterium]
MEQKIQVIFNDENLSLIDSDYTRSFSIGTEEDKDIRIETDKAKISLNIFPCNSHWWIQNCGSEPTPTVLSKPFDILPIIDELTISFAEDKLKFILQGQIKSSPEDKLKSQVYDQIMAYMKSESALASSTSDDELTEKIDKLIDNFLAKLTDLPSGFQKENFSEVKKEIIQDILHLGPLEPLISDDSITEIMVINYKTIYVEQHGKISLSDRKFRSPEHLRTVVERIVSPIGRRIDESSPLVDARLPDGSRVNAVIPPVTPDGVCLTIRKFGKTVFNVEKLIEFGSMTPIMGEFLEACIKARKNIVVSGGTGSGKTSLLNALSNYLPSDERIITIEDSLELKLQQKHVVRMEARPPNAEGKGEISIRNLVKNSLRMRPDRIVIGECRGGEALDMLQAMNTGHDGSLTTIHANSPKDTVSRLETLVLMAGMDLPLKAIRNQICSAVNLIVQTARYQDGSRKVSSVSEITGVDKNGEPLLNEIFAFKQEGIDKTTGKVIGKHYLVSIPTFIDEFVKKGINFTKEKLEMSEQK